MDAKDTLPLRPTFTQFHIHPIPHSSGSTFIRFYDYPVSRCFLVKMYVFDYQIHAKIAGFNVIPFSMKMPLFQFM